jgi:beta-glucanase (GH16 family)
MVRIGAYTQGAQTDSGKEEFTKASDNFDKRWNNYHRDSSLRGVWLDVASEWTNDNVCVYIDSALVVCENYRWVENSGAMANPANVILNLAVGGEWAGRYGIDDSKPMTYDVDYVRVYEKHR